MASTYDVITDRILQQLEKGVVPWRKPWKEASAPKSLVSQKEYRGINLFLLNAAGYASPYWLSFNQARDLGATVRKGEHGMPVVFWLWQRDAKETPEGSDSDETHGKDHPVLCKYYTVFNVEQVDGLKVKRELLYPQNGGQSFSIELAEAIYANMPNRPALKTGPAAWYRPSEDAVTLPAKESFTEPEEYYCVLYHELGHSTGHASRLNREGVTAKHGFGSDPYAREELVAEMTAAFLCGRANIETITLDNSAAYIAWWIWKLGKSKSTMCNQKARKHLLRFRRRISF